MFDDPGAGHHLGLDVPEASRELSLVLRIRDPADESGIHPRGAVDAGEDGPKPSDVGFMDQHHAGAIQTRQQGLDMMTHAESKDQNACRLDGIDAFGPAARFSQRLMKTGQSATTRDESDERPVGRHLKGDRACLRLLDPRGHLGAGDRQTGQIAGEYLVVVRADPGIGGI